MMAGLDEGIAAVDVTDDAATTNSTVLLDLSTDAIAIILAHLGTRPRLTDLLGVAAVCSDLRTVLADEAVWQTLCKYAWSISDVDLSSDWPRLSSFRSLYAVLEVWAPYQGFHTCLETFPWGALFLLRFRRGRFVGELLHHASSVDGANKCEAQDPVTILEVDFDANEGVDESSLPAWLSAAHSPRMRWCGERVVSCTTHVGTPSVYPCEGPIPGAHYFDEKISLVPHRVRCRQYLQVQLAADDATEEAAHGDEEARAADASSSRNRDAIIETCKAWLPTRRDMGAADEGARWLKRMNLLPRHCAGRQVTLGLVDGPTAASAEASAACVRSGLYIGDYSHNPAYGLYGNEALLLERRTFVLDGEGVDGESDELRAFFQRGDDSRPLPPAVTQVLDWLHSTPTSGGRCTLLIGRKVTGDIHVPMGAATFVAVLEPQMDMGRIQPVPTQAVTRAGHERVVRGWDGFGTLAYPGFGKPSWDPGWLVQLEDDDDGRRFAFVWGSRQDDSANMLTQVVAQSDAVFVGEDETMRPYWPPATPHTPG